MTPGTHACPDAADLKGTLDFADMHEADALEREALPGGFRFRRNADRPVVWIGIRFRFNEPKMKKREGVQKLVKRISPLLPECGIPSHEAALFK
jgi:hypothetical protein